MKVAVIFLEKKFIVSYMRPPTGSVSVLRSQVVIPKESSVAELKTEIERVHRALFQSSGYVNSL